MAKISLKKYFRKRYKFRLSLLLSLLILGLVFAQFILFQGERGAKAATCTVSSGETTIPANCENKDVIVNGGKVYLDRVAMDGSSSCADVTSASCDTKRRFNSLTVNGGTLTHGAVSVSDMAQDTILNGGSVNGSLADNKTGSARWRKVEIEVANDIVFTNGGKIEVDAAGYPGGAINTYNNGFGPGGGIGHDNSGNSKAAKAGGGGFGGAGGSTLVAGGIANPANFNPSSFLLEFGSGGGAAYNNGLSVAGGNGGGRIHLRAGGDIRVDQGSIISANGGIGYSGYQATGRSVSAGGGSGGMIWLEAHKFIFPAGGASVAAGTTSSGLSLGSAGTVSAETSLSSIFGSAIGGSSLNYPSGSTCSGSIAECVNGGSGGGGRIIISYIVPQAGARIEKSLAPKARDGVSNISFNPYALKEGDVIEVSLVVNEVVGKIDISDRILETVGSAKMFCVPSPVSVAEGSVQGIYNHNSKSVSWLGVSDSNGDKEINVSYQCIVQAHL